MAERRLIRPGEYGAVLYRRVEPAVVERRVIVPPDSVRLATGEYVAESEFKKLTPAGQAYLKKRGVAAFNIEQQRVGKQLVSAYEEAKAYVERETAARKRWYEENIIEVGPKKDPILRAAFEKLTTKVQKLLKDVGLTRFNIRAEASQREFGEFKKAHIEIKPDTWVDRAEWVKLTSSQRAEVRATGKYTLEPEPAEEVVPIPPRIAVPVPDVTRPRVDARALAAGVTIPRETASFLSTAWKFLTPWKEGEGETLWDFVKGIPKKVVTPDIPPQEELKATYEAERASPLWSRLLFGYSVEYDKKANTYHPLAIAEFPTGKKALAVPAAKVLTKTIEINWNKLISPKVFKPDINWNDIARAVKQLKVRNAYDAAKWAAAQKKWFPKTTLKPGSPEYQKWMAELTKQGMKNAATAAAKARQFDALSKLGVALVPGPGPSVGWVPFRPSELSTEKMKELIGQWANMRPSDAIRQINDANLVTNVVAHRPELLSELLSKLTPVQRAKVISRLQPATQEAIKAGNLDKAQELANTQLIAFTQLAPATAEALAVATQAAVEAMTVALAEGNTMTEAQVMASTAAAEAVQTSLEAATLLEPATQTVVQSATSAITQTAVGAAIDTVTGYKLLTPPVPPTRVPPTRVPPKVPPKKPPRPPKIPPIPPILLPLPGVKAIRRKVYPAGTIVWRMGAFWKIIPPPYTIPKPLSSRTPPRGVTVLKGTPQQTLTFIGDKVPFTNVAFDLGVVDGFIDVKTKRIVFTGYGELTDVGKRLPSPTKGLSLEKAKALGIGLPRIRKTKTRVPRVMKESTPGVITQRRSK